MGYRPARVCWKIEPRRGLPIGSSWRRVAGASALSTAPCGSRGCGKDFRKFDGLRKEWLQGNGARNSCVLESREPVYALVCFLRDDTKLRGELIVRAAP